MEEYKKVAQKVAHIFLLDLDAYRYCVIDGHYKLTGDDLKEFVDSTASRTRETC